MPGGRVRTTHSCVTATTDRNTSASATPSGWPRPVSSRRASWIARKTVELATLERVSWFNNHRLMAPLGYVPPAGFEVAYYRNLEQQASSSA